MRIVAHSLGILPESTAAFRPVTPSLRMVLRDATAADHEIVDSTFAWFDLTLSASYTQFLMAHARVLCALEPTVSGLWSGERARLPLLQADLADLGVAVTADASPAAISDATGWGILYVLEGSRLGGRILAGRVGAGLPVRYLSAAHQGGSWRLFGDALEQAGGSGGDDWCAAAVAGAKLAFAQFAASASEIHS